MSSKLVVLLWRHCIFFEFSKWLPPPSWIFEIAKFYWLFGAERVETHQHTKLYQNRSIGCEDIKTFSIFQDGGRRHLDCQIHKILFADSVWKAQTHHRAKCRQNWLSVVETLQFFEFSKWPSPPSWIFEIAKFYWLLWQRGSRHISMPNFDKICQSIAKNLRFFSIFQDGGCRHLGLSNSQNFIGWQ